MLIRFAKRLLVVTAVLAGCREEGASPSAPTDPIPAPATEPSPTERSPVASECTGISRGRDVVLSLSKPAEAPPPAGGALVAGTYDLVELHLYTGPKEVEDDDHSAVVGVEAAQITMLVTPDAIRMAAGTGERDESSFFEERIATGWYHVEEDEIVYEEICPTLEMRRIPYSTSGRALVLFPRPDRAEIYRLRD